MKSVLVDQFDQCYPPEWCKAILKAFQEVWYESRNHCRSRLFGEKEGEDLLPHYCRARFETEFRRVTKDLLPESTSESRPNSVGSYSHTFVEAKSPSEGAVVLTASAVKNKAKLPRRAKFRCDYNHNGQGDLFDEIISKEDNPVYGWILYSHPRPNTAPFFLIAFPSPDSAQIIEKIDLIARYPGIVSMPELDREESIPMPMSPEVEKLAPVEEIKKTNHPDIRRRKKASGE
jgi:hypothetical protein